MTSTTTSGSKLSSVALRLDLASRTLAATNDRALLEELSATARGVVDDLRDTVWIVDAGHDSLHSLVARMESAAVELLAGCHHRFRIPADLPDLPLPMGRRRHLYLWFKEALHNAARHGRPRRVDVGIFL